MKQYTGAAWLIKCIKRSESQHLWTVNILKALKHCSTLLRSSFSYFLVTRRELKCKKFCLCSIWNLQTVCQHIDSRWQVFSLVKTVQHSQFKWYYLGDWKTFYESWILKYLKKKHDPHRWCIFEIIDSKRRCYLNALEGPNENTYQKSTS